MRGHTARSLKCYLEEYFRIVSKVHCGALSRRGLNPIKVAYDPVGRMAGLIAPLKLTRPVCQQSCNRAYCYTELVVSSLAVAVTIASTDCAYYPTTRLYHALISVVQVSTWSILNRFRTGQGRCAANLYKWHMPSTDKCQCGAVQTEPHRRVLSANQIYWWRWFVSTSLGGWLCNHVATEGWSG